MPKIERNGGISLLRLNELINTLGVKHVKRPRSEKSKSIQPMFMEQTKLKHNEVTSKQEQTFPLDPSPSITIFSCLSETSSSSESDIILYFTAYQ